MTYKALRFPIFLSVILAVLAAIGAAYYLLSFKAEATVPAVTAAMVLAALLLPYFLLMSTQCQRFVTGIIRIHPTTVFAIPAYALGLYVVFAFGTASFAPDSLLRLSLFLALPLALILMAKRLGTAFNFLDALAIFAVWLPFDTGLIKAIWLFPQGDGAYVLNAIIGVSFVVTMFVCYRALPHIGYGPQWTRTTVRTAIVGFLAFVAIAVPLGIATGFIHYNGSLSPLKTFGAFPGILLFIAIPEELLFRGLFQNFLTQKIRHPALAIAIAAVVFGATHLNNGPAPDWRYFLLASIAGLIYGLAYHRTKNLTAAALIHAAVDATWIGFFMV